MERSLASGCDDCQGVGICLAFTLPGFPVHATVGQDVRFCQ
jgi:hypothetical protein